MRLELHCHSTHSDGSFTAAEVALAAVRTGVALFCLTDHDTCAGYGASAATVEPVGCRVLRGLELSCRHGNRTIHVLLYGVQDGAGLDVLANRLDAIHRERRERIRAIVARLSRLGIELDEDAILTRTHGRTPGRPDVARELVARGHCASMPEAFARWLRDGGPADVPLERLGVLEGLELAAIVGAKASLAHPHTLGDVSIVRDLFVRHREAGLRGIEAFYGAYSRPESAKWMTLAHELDLVATGGSDFHGEANPAVTQPGINLAPDVLGPLLVWLEV